MTALVNPALQRFVEQLSHPLVVGQVTVRRHPRGFELRHEQDAETVEDQLRTVSVSALRSLAEFSEAGQFRPLKSAPDLRAGWCCVAIHENELERALEHLYPGFLPDWFATLAGLPPVTHFRPFLARQTGRYHAVNSMSDVEAASVIRACCAARFCLKRRLWTVKGLATDAASEKSVIPCLEPCAILLDLARHAIGLEQSTSEFLEADTASLEQPVESSAADVRAADFADARNPRRIQFQIEREKQRSGLA